MANYDAGQLKVIRTINAEARRRYGNDPARRKRYSETAMTIGRVESNFHNVKGGDADSTNWRQERASIYGGDMSIRRSVNRVFDEMEQHDKGQDIGTLAADVQRPAAQYRNRYGLHVAEAQKLAGGAAGQLESEHRGQLQAGIAPTLNPGGETTDAKGAMLAALLDPHKHSSLLERYQSQISSGSFTTTTKPSVTDGTAPMFHGGGFTAGTAGKRGLTAKANAIDARHLPYKLGGGHGDGGGGPLDCSGAVSKLLGINPRVASQFKTWGKPGRGKDFTIYAKDTHVLVEIGGHLWGTSNSNPGGGAGWIPRSQISADYLKGFTARH